MVCRTVHRHDALFRQQVIQKSEDRFFVFTCVFRTTDQDQLFIKVHRDYSFAAAVMLFWVCLKAWAIDDGEVCDKTVKLRALWAAKKVTNKEVVPCQLCHHAYIDRNCWIRTANQVLDKVITTLHVL